MLNYDSKKWWKRVLFFGAALICVFSLWYTNKLVKVLANQEDKKIKLWANATKQLINSEGDINFLLDIIKDNETIPTILVDDEGKVITTRNLDSVRVNNDNYIQKQLEIMKSEREPIKIVYDETNNRYNYLYYKNSTILSQLKTYPYIQLTLIAFLGIIGYLAFSYSRKAEQNRVWVGMSKETAHQLGTPISSIREWVNILKLGDGYDKVEILSEIDHDIQRLELITERFSKIGSEPVLSKLNLDEIIPRAVGYLKNRVSEKVKIYIDIVSPGNWAEINVPLFDWVIENICKNSIDSMNGEGDIKITIKKENNNIITDISDTGKGIPKSKYKEVFKPGYTTKKRGWGLGLTLVKRIVEEYHKGQIFVHHSENLKGSTIRIVLKASS